MYNKILKVRNPELKGVRRHASEKDAEDVVERAKT